MAVSLSVRIEDANVRELISGLHHRMADLSPAMKTVGEIVRTSVVRNFEVGGRPPWKPLSKTTLARRKGHKILMRQGFAGGLAGSIHYRAAGDRVTIGTNKVYAAVHQFGARKGSFGTFTFTVREHLRRTPSGRKVTVREHQRTASLPWGDIPARPFLMVQREDWDEIRDALAEYITGGKT